ncbi:hypothetical protein A2422_04385 [Candidatus Woesebacteria bacterium RIFOXYC1_FULL_31_51]|nr:MAG: hypothetical protein UR17_C0001G0241 [Candidatus Woesebacteria bacterium GW2011_GWF1_31_35]OGM72905.1 MAG: hypothetical protein A2185_03995 [Candidatus Woesebacteria bacterium RIFOXYA1_FULL_31_71]OGM82115.1 MAG: hypothetical protein A2422_04385 [Candidatus Woesebacteria bacterium RIFOXYC1_FULL_31_51]OGM86155.1 MAG: hypothetical protein A2595_01325 [Candidatus Woesebacteria bacterium RIFOXYD1_FULL_31_53]HBP39891.1 hypothetical protein [Candidatus Woesebacteria bacterium]
MSYKEMGAFISRTSPSIQSKVRFLPIQQKVNKYKINQKFFTKWSEPMAYILGFITADGNICRTGNSHMIQIACDDKDIIEKIKIELSCDTPIQIRSRLNGKSSYQLRFSDKHIYQNLIKLGITPRKSLTIKPPIKIPHVFINDYIRGFFDGDGSVWISKRTRQERLVSVFYTASIKMIKFIFEIIKNNFPLFTGKIQRILTPKKNRFYYSITLGHRDSLLLYKYMYKGSKIFSNRKHNIFKKIYDNQFIRA